MIYDYKLTTGTGHVIDLADYKGKVILIVNTATGCGFTSQYSELAQWYNDYHDKGLEIVDIPCNQFMGQEPGSIEQILAMPALDLEGVMTMAPAHDPSAARKTFSGLRDLRDELEPELDGKLPVLSCGMSDDFGIAVEEGSTLVRLGRIVFDPGYELD